MRSYCIDGPGGSDALYQAVVDVPAVGPDEVLVKVGAISINPADVKVKFTDAGLSMVAGDTRPVILGWDIAGMVEETGANVRAFQRGDRVFGMVNFPGHGKAYAEYVAAPQSHLAIIPEGVGNERAAATTLAALTACQVLKDRVKPGDKVLVHAGSGGVGHFAIQIARHFGAKVFTTSSEKNKAFVMSLGADTHIDYRAQPFESAVSDLDLVFDTQGGDVLVRSLDVLRSGGQLVSIAAMEVPSDVRQVAMGRGVKVDTVLVESNGEDMAVLANWLASGVLNPVIARTFAFDDLPAAHTEVEAGRTVGKVIVTL